MSYVEQRVLVIAARMASMAEKQFHNFVSMRT